MSKQKADYERKKNILKARRWIEGIEKKNANEADTSTRIYDICEMLMGFDRYEHITKEFQIPTAGQAVYCDLAIQINQEEPPKPDLLIEVKKVGLKLTRRYIGQAASYAIDIGCEWILVTNGRDWQLYHVSFTKPPQTTLVESWDLINDTPTVLSEKFSLISYRNFKKDGLSLLWQKYLALMPKNLLEIILTEQSLNSMRSKLRKAKGIAVAYEEVIAAIHRILNQEAIGEMEKIRISLPTKKQRKYPTPQLSVVEEKSSQEVINGQ